VIDLEKIFENKELREVARLFINVEEIRRYEI